MYNQEDIRMIKHHTECTHAVFNNGSSVCSNDKKWIRLNLVGERPPNLREIKGKHEHAWAEAVITKTPDDANIGTTVRICVYPGCYQTRPKA